MGPLILGITHTLTTTADFVGPLLECHLVLGAGSSGLQVRFFF